MKQAQMLLPLPERNALQSFQGRLRLMACLIMVHSFAWHMTLQAQVMCHSAKSQHTVLSAPCGD